MKNQSDRSPVVSFILAAGVALFPSSGISATLIQEGLENLTVGALAGQDGWTQESSSSGVVASVAQGTGANTGNVIVASVSPTNPPSGGVRLRKIIGAGSLAGIETDAVLQFDFQRSLTDQQGNASYFAFKDSSSEAGFSAGVEIRFQDDRFTAFDAGGNGTGVSRSGISAGEYTDWYSMRIVFDLTTSGADYYYRNLTRGDSDFTFFLNRSLVHTNLTSAPGTWDSFELFVPGGTSMDNLTFASSLAAVPEPSGMLLAGVAMLGWLCRRRRAAAGCAMALTCTSQAAVVTFAQADLTLADFTPSGGQASGSTDGATTSMNESDLSTLPDNYEFSAIAVAGQGILKASVSETRAEPLREFP